MSGADRLASVFLAGTPAFADYRRDLTWAQDYALFNRRVMLCLLGDVIRRFWPRIQLQRPISCHHNYVAEEVHFGEELLITRKGAVRAGRGSTPGWGTVIPVSASSRLAGFEPVDGRSIRPTGTKHPRVAQW